MKTKHAQKTEKQKTEPSIELRENMNNCVKEERFRTKI